MTNLPPGCGYNFIHPHVFCLNSNSVPGTLVELMAKECKHKFGWHFVAHSNMNYYSEEWYKDQTAYVSFECNIDLVNVMLKS